MFSLSGELLEGSNYLILDEAIGEDFAAAMEGTSHQLMRSLNARIANTDTRACKTSKCSNGAISHPHPLGGSHSTAYMNHGKPNSEFTSSGPNFYKGKHFHDGSHVFKELHPVLSGRNVVSAQDDELVTAKLAACSICFLLLAFMLLYLLYEYVRQRELPTPYLDVGNVELYGAVYTQRVANIIRTATAETSRNNDLRTKVAAGLGMGNLGALGASSIPFGNRSQDRMLNYSRVESHSHSNDIWSAIDGPVHVHSHRHADEDKGHVRSHSRQKRCHSIPRHLVGNVSSNVNLEQVTLTLTQVKSLHPDIAAGGEWQPEDCVARYRLAVIIPYRDRLAHLTVLLAHLLPVLKRQQLHFKIFVVEQSGSHTFNKGRIMNAAFKEALKMFDFQCVVFHDVDLIPEDDRNMYTCPQMPRHLSVAIDEMNYKLAYMLLVGGVLNMRLEHYLKVNGYSNMYWGWGAEDDDMAYRILHVGLKIFRPPANIARYQMIKHQKRKPTSWNIRNKLLTTAVKRYQLDGLNSVQYTVQFIHADPVFTHIMVDIGQPDVRTQR